MSWFLPSTTVTIKRGSTEDEFGDQVDSNVIVAENVPAAVTESVLAGSRSQLSYTSADQRGTVVESYVIRLRPNVTVVEQDRLIDERQGVVYLVRSVYNPQSIVRASDVRVEATRVSGSSHPVNG